MRRIFTIIVVVAVIAALAVGLMVYTGSLRLNHPTQPVHGVDVSHYQGEIDWPVLAGQDIQFAFVKATEGSIYTDETFEANWQGAQAAGLRVGAYHFFSYDSDGLSQAENYIAAVPVLPGALPPVIDVEFYGDYFRETPEAGDVLPQLTAMVEALRDHYGVDPILYVTEQSYALYVGRLSGLRYLGAQHLPEAQAVRQARLDLLAVHRPGQAAGLRGLGDLHRHERVPRHPGGLRRLSGNLIHHESE